MFWPAHVIVFLSFISGEVSDSLLDKVLNCQPGAQGSHPYKRRMFSRFMLQTRPLANRCIILLLHLPHSLGGRIRQLVIAEFKEMK